MLANLSDPGIEVRMGRGRGTTGFEEQGFSQERLVLTEKQLYSFSTATGSNHHKFSGFKQLEG